MCAHVGVRADTASLLGASFANERCVWSFCGSRDTTLLFSLLTWRHTRSRPPRDISSFLFKSRIFFHWKGAACCSDFSRRGREARQRPTTVYRLRLSLLGVLRVGETGVWAYGVRWSVDFWRAGRGPVASGVGHSLEIVYAEYRVLGFKRTVVTSTY